MSLSKYVKKKVLTTFLFGLTMALAGCGTNHSKTGSAAGDGKLKVEATFYPMYEFTVQVAGSLADVHTLIPTGVEPHDWEPSPRDIGKIENADVLVYNGAGLEGWVDQVVSALDSSKQVQVEASQGVELLSGFREEGEDSSEDGLGSGFRPGEGSADPHVWLSPVQAIKEVRNIQAGLTQAAPQHASEFKANADAYVAKLERLNQEFKQGLGSAKRKDFITQHAAFGYLARDYGLDQVPIAGLSPDQEPSASSMADVVKFAQMHHTKTIFFETLLSSKVAETVAREIGAKTAVLNPIEGLTEEEVADHLDYVAVMHQNLKALEQALNEE